MNKCLLTILLIIPLWSFSQTDTIAHLYTFGSLANDVGEDIAATNDGGLIVVGSTASSGDGNTDVYLLKIDSVCNREWSWALGGANNDWGYAVKQTFDNGYIIAASSNSYGSFGYDAMLLKRDSLGSFQWQKMYGGNDWDFAYDVIQTFDSGYVFCGETYNNTAGFSDVYVVKTNVFGDTLWTRTVGGSLIEKGNSLLETSDSNIVVAGSRNTISDSTQAYVLKFDKNGTLLWDSVYGGLGYEKVNKIIETQDGSFVFTGSSNSNNPGVLDFYMSKIDRNGTLIWEQSIVGADDDEGYSVYELSDGNFWIIGYTKSFGGGKKDAKIFLITSTGQWGGQNSTFGAIEDEVATSFAMGLNGAMYLTGYTNGYGYGLNDVMLIRVDTVVKYQQFTASSAEDIAPISVNELQNRKQELQIFPNPANSTITISSEKYPIQLQIFNSNGLEMISKKLVKNNSCINLALIPAGFYTVQFSNNDGLMIVEKLVITK